VAMIAKFTVKMMVNLKKMMNLYLTFGYNLMSIL
jgi:hypothetical protein